MARKKPVSPRLIELYAIIGHNIERRRGTMSQEEIGQRAGVTRGTINAIENGQGCTLKTLIKIADALGISPADLFITDADWKEVTYKHVLLMRKVNEDFIKK